MQQRYYDPRVARFWSVDPVTVSSVGGNFNRYWYGNGNPYRFTDPDGRAPFSGHLCDMGCDGGSFNAGSDNSKEGERIEGQTRPVDLANLSNPNAWVALNGANPNQAATSQNDQNAEEVENLAKTVLEMSKAKGSPFHLFSKAFTAKDAADLSLDELRITMQWGVKDIERYRATDGLHITNPVGSLIPWQTVRVNWSYYDPGPKWNSYQVMGHFLRRVNYDGRFEREGE
jgi:hypothetical protein